MVLNGPARTQIGLTIGGLLLVLVAAVVLFAWLAQEADTERLDTVIRAAVHQLSSPTLTQIIEAFSFLGGAAVLVVMSVVAVSLLAYFRRAREAVLLGVTMLGAVGLDVVLKGTFHRQRPAPFFGLSPNSYSFPSGHALASFCFYATVALILSARVRRRGVRVSIWIAAVLLIGMIGFSRVYLGVHYASDVIGGYCAAVFWVGAVSLLRKRDPVILSKAFWFRRR